MGLVIKGTKVLVDHSLNEHLVTTLAGNPRLFNVENQYGKIDVFSIFTRLKATAQERRNRQQRKLGDNCPMIYALKGKDGLVTGYRSVREMLLIGRQIVSQHLKLPDDTVIVCVPSSHSVVRHLAQQLSELLNLPIVDGLLAKASVESAVADLEHAISIAQTYEDKKNLGNIRQAVSKQEVLALKDVSTRYRSVIRPVALKMNTANVVYPSILLVDDLVSTGTSLIAAKNMLRSNGKGQDFQALTLFSKV